MGEYITIGDGLVLSLFSIVVVFVTLLAISYLIDLMTIVLSKLKKEEPVAKAKTKVSKEVEIEAVDSSSKDKVDDEELVAVISAAIAASLGVAIPEINIRSIKRTGTTSNAWAEMGKSEQISGKL